METDPDPFEQLSQSIDQIADVCQAAGRSVNALLLSFHPMDLLPALLEMSEDEKQRLLKFYQHHEAYHHCDVIHKMTDAYNNSPDEA